MTFRVAADFPAKGYSGPPANATAGGVAHPPQPAIPVPHAQTGVIMRRASWPPFASPGRGRCDRSHRSRGAAEVGEVAEVKESRITATHAFRRTTSLVVKITTNLGQREFRSLVMYMDLDPLWITPPKEEINLEGVGAGSELAITAEVALDRFETTVILRGITRWPDTLWRVDWPREIRKGIGRAQLRADVRLPGSVLEVRRTDLPPPAEGEEEEPPL